MYETEIIDIAKAMKMQNRDDKIAALTAIPNWQDILALSVEQLEAVELATISAMKKSYNPYSFEGDIDYTALYAGVQAEYASKGRLETYRQKGFGIATTKDSVQMISAEKTFQPAVTYTMPGWGLNSTNEVSVAFGEAIIEGKKHLFSKQIIDKIVRDASGQKIARNPSEFALYAMAGGRADKETLILRMDSSSQQHDNCFDFGKDWSKISPNPVRGYHIHHMTFFGTGVSHKQGYGNGISTDCIAITTERLSLYLKALDGKSVPEFAGVDLKQTYGLPYTYMAEKGLYPQMDLKGIATDLKGKSAFSDVQKLCDDYLQSISNPQKGFENFVSGLDFLNGLDAFREANKSTLTRQEMLVITDAISAVAHETFENLTRAYELENQQVVSNEQEDTAQNEQEGATQNEPEKEQDTGAPAGENGGDNASSSEEETTSLNEQDQENDKNVNVFDNSQNLSQENNSNNQENSNENLPNNSSQDEQQDNATNNQNNMDNANAPGTNDAPPAGTNPQSEAGADLTNMSEQEINQLANNLVDQLAAQLENGAAQSTESEQSTTLSLDDDLTQ